MATSKPLVAPARAAERAWAASASGPGEAIPLLAEAVERRRGAEGALRLRGPELRRRHLHRFLAWMLRAPLRIEVELDDLGAFVVERMDGRNLSSLAGDLAAHLGLSQREAEVALADFMRLLMRRRLAVLRPAPAP
jgi:hypothetical protein